MMIEGNKQALGMICQTVHHPHPVQQSFKRFQQQKWYSDIVFYLLNLTCHEHLVGHKRRSLRLQATKYCLTQDGLGWKNPDGLILTCIDEEQSVANLFVP